MVRGQFETFVESVRDCDESQLEAAVQRGIRKAKNDRIDLRKVLSLAASFLATAALLIFTYKSPSQLADRYALNTAFIYQQASEIIYVNMNAFFNTIFDLLIFF